MNSLVIAGDNAGREGWSHDPLARMLAPPLPAL